MLFFGSKLLHISQCVSLESSSSCSVIICETLNSFSCSCCLSFFPDLSSCLQLTTRMERSNSFNHLEIVFDRHQVICIGSHGSSRTEACMQPWPAAVVFICFCALASMHSQDQKHVCVSAVDFVLGLVFFPGVFRHKRPVRAVFCSDPLLRYYCPDMNAMTSQ